MTVPLWPAGTVKEAGDTAKRVVVPLHSAIEVTLRLAVPPFCTWMLSVLGAPTVTVPKDSDVGFTAIDGAGADAPVALTLTFRGLPWFVALCVRAMQPLSVAAPVGV